MVPRTLPQRVHGLIGLMPKKYYFYLEDLKSGYPNAMVADYGLTGEEVWVYAVNNFAAETIAMEEYKKGRWKNRKNGRKTKK